MTRTPTPLIGSLLGLAGFEVRDGMSLHLRPDAARDRLGATATGAPGLGPHGIGF